MVFSVPVRASVLLQLGEQLLRCSVKPLVLAALLGDLAFLSCESNYRAATLHFHYLVWFSAVPD